MMSYETIPGLEDLYLEDSFILEVEERAGVLRLHMEFVLTPNHAEYEPPKPGEHHCYRRGVLAFRDVEQASWTGPGLKPSRDANGEIDFGNIDSLVVDGNTYRIEGDFGRVTVLASALDLTLGEP